jgi:hypothetical protein
VMQQDDINFSNYIINKWRHKMYEQ